MSEPLLTIQVDPRPTPEAIEDLRLRMLGLEAKVTQRMLLHGEVVAVDLEKARADVRVMLADWARSHGLTTA